MEEVGLGWEEEEEKGRYWYVMVPVSVLKTRICCVVKCGADELLEGMGYMVYGRMPQHPRQAQDRQLNRASRKRWYQVFG